MRSGLYIPLLDELADPALVARLCAETEEAGWHGVFVWDHLRWHEPVVDVADTQILRVRAELCDGRIYTRDRRLRACR